MGSNFTFVTSVVELDLLAWVEPIGDFAALMKSAEDYSVGKMSVAVIALDDLIRVKQHINRSKDRDSLYQLLAIKKLREETGLK